MVISDMDGSVMNLRTALPGLVTGAAGLVAGAVAVAFGVPLLGAAAGVLALVAGIASLRLAQRLHELAALQTLMADELRTLRISHQARDHPSNGESGAVIDATGVTGVTGSGLQRHDPGAEYLVDRTTGLFSETFFRVALESRIAAARRHLRPVAMVLLEVVEGLPQNEPTAVDANLVSETIRSTLREADTACRLRNGYFALLLEDTPENGAIWTVERMRRQLVESRRGLTVWAGIACYPAHAFTPDEILTAAERALVAAREWRQDRIEVAVSAD
jgi:two-component system cell cycle response regulator